MYTKLTSFKNLGGLFLSSESSFKVIIEAEKSYLYLTNNLTKINVPNLQKKIIFYFINKFALDFNIFNSLNCENVGLLDRPHKIFLIPHLVKRFLSVRLQSYSKQFSSDVLNTVSQRQKLTKTILFYNQ